MRLVAQCQKYRLLNYSVSKTLVLQYIKSMIVSSFIKGMKEYEVHLVELVMPAGPIS